MKRLLFSILFCLALASNVMAAGTVTQVGPTIVRDPSDPLRINQSFYTVTMTVTADASDASVPATVVAGTASTGNNNMRLWGWYLYSVKTLSGSTQITNGASYTIKDSSGFDLMGGKGASAITNSTTVPVKTFAFPTGGSFSPVSGPLTLAITGNAVNSAGLTVTLEFVR